MACSYRVDPEHRLVLFRPSGRFTESDFLDLCRAAYEHPERTPQFAHVWDARFIDELVMNANVIPLYREFLAENKPRITEDQVAVIATRPMTETFASMLVQIGEHQSATFRLFSTPEAAAEWLGRPVEALSH